MVAIKPQVVVVGGGFGGLWAVRSLAGSDVSVTLVDRENHHLFQPLLYQVATGGLSPADIASPLRAVLSSQSNVRVIRGEVTGLDPKRRVVELKGTTIPYSYLVVATGVTHHYFGKEQWRSWAPGLKTINDATGIRNRILDSFEKAEREPNDDKRRALMSFVIVGGGPTGVEMAGAVGELARQSLRSDFDRIDPMATRIVLVEAKGRVLPSFPEKLSRQAKASLERLGVEVRTATRVSAIEEGRLTLVGGQEQTDLRAGVVIWAAGIQGSFLGEILSQRAGAELDGFGRVKVREDCSISAYPEVFVIGDLAHFVQDGAALPGVAPVAMQQGSYVGRAIRARIAGRAVEPFRYVDKGKLAVIGRAAAVADFGRFKFSGYPAWLLWVFVHLMYLVGFENRLLVFLQWAWSYVTRNRSARLITSRGA